VQANATNGQMRLVVQRANTDDYAGTQAPGAFIIEPYSYGMSMSYPGTIQCNTAFFQVGPMQPFTGVPTILGSGYGGILIVINETDVGGLYLTSKAGANPPSTSLTRLISQTYANGDGGPMQFITRGASGFQFMTGNLDAEAQGVIITSAGHMGVGRGVVAPATHLHIADTGGAAFRVQDSNTVTGGAIQFNQAGALMSVNTYGPTGVFSGTPLKLSATGVGFNNNAPVAKAAVITTPTSDTVGTKAAIDAIRVVLTNLGLTA